MGGAMGGRGRSYGRSHGRKGEEPWEEAGGVMGGRGREGLWEEEGGAITTHHGSANSYSSYSHLCNGSVPHTPTAKLFVQSFGNLRGMGGAKVTSLGRYRRA